LTSVAEAYGEVVWFWRRGAGVKSVGKRKHPKGDGGKRAVLRGEHEVSRKAIAQGRPGCFRRTCMLVCISCYAQTAHETAGAARTRSSRGLPCDLYFVRAKTMQTSGAMCREKAASHSIVVLREGGGPSIPETPMIEPISRGVLDPSAGACHRARIRATRWRRMTAERARPFSHHC
jgi:hypothetical protein